MYCITKTFLGDDEQKTLSDSWEIERKYLLTSYSLLIIAIINDKPGVFFYKSHKISTDNNTDVK